MHPTKNRRTNQNNNPRVSEGRGGRRLTGRPHGFGLWRGFNYEKGGEHGYGQLGEYGDSSSGLYMWNFTERLEDPPGIKR